MKIANINSTNKLDTTKTTSNIQHAFYVLVCFFIALTLSVSLTPHTLAFGDVRKSDVVADDTVETLGLTVANCPSVSSEYAFVMDSTGKAYFNRSGDVQTKIASITKFMTAIVACSMGSAEDKIVISESAAAIGESSAGLKSGDELSLKDALLGMLVPSGNDCAQAICEFYGAKLLAQQGTTGTDKEATQAFVAAMNAKATEIGMTNSVFANPHGLDDGEYAADHHSTAHDVAIMCAQAMKNDLIRSSINNQSATLNVLRGGENVQVTVESTDELIGNLDGFLGGKTGFTDLAGACFAGCTNRAGVEIYTVALKAPDTSSRFSDTSTMTDWFYNHYINYKISNTSMTTTMNVAGVDTQVPLIANVAHKDYVNTVVPATFENKDATISLFDLQGNVSQTFSAYDLSGDVYAGDVVGQVVFLQHNKEIARVDVIACEDVRAPNILERIGISIDRFFRGIQGSQTVATSELINKSSLINDKSL